MNIEHPGLSHLQGLRNLWQEAFGDTAAFLDSFFSTAFSPDRCLCITEGEAVVAAAYWLPCGDYAYIYAVATAQNHRGKGLCHRLMAQIHQVLVQQGYVGAVLVPGDAGLRKFYAGMGYTNFGGVEEFSCSAGEAVAIRAVDGAEFSHLRLQYLPEGGLVQDGVSVEFLSRWAQFYAGEDFLLTAVVDGNCLRGVELLGNRHAAAGILGALGIPVGRFQIPGNTPFGMCKVLVGKNYPTYLGFAFD